MKQLTYILLLTAIVLSQGCNRVDPITPPVVSTDQQFLLSTNAEDGQASELTNIKAYVFSGGVLAKVIDDIVLNGSVATINVPANAQIYFLAGMSTLPSSLGSLEVGTTSVDDFVSLCCDALPQQQAGAATLFLTGYYPGTKSSEPMVYPIDMTRSVARLDLDTSSDPLISITRVVANNVPLSSVMFAERTAERQDIATGTVEKLFDTPVAGEFGGFMYLFESLSPVDLTLYGTYNQVPIVVKISVPALKRNSAYTIKVNNAGTTVNGSIVVKEWNDGGVVQGNPDLNQSVAIDMLHTSLEDGIAVDEMANHVTISEQGGTLSLALAADMPLNIASIDGLNELITIGNPTSTTVGDKLITTIPITAREQGRGRLPYQVKISLKSDFTQNPYDYVTVDVEGNQEQIPTVSFAGYELMAFNSTGSDLEDQIYLPEGVSIQQMYDEFWSDCTGRMFQYGRMPGFFPYERMATGKPLPNFLEWNQSNGAPCPAGFRMLTSAELYKIMPPSKDNVLLNGSVPINYTINGKTARMEIIVPSKKVNMPGVSNITPRYWRLTCGDDVLFISMGGYKWTDSSGASPAINIGGQFFIMTSDRAVDYTKVCGHNGTNTLNNHSDKQPRNTNNYNFVRCIKL